MGKPVLVTAAWPYANAYIHVGNLTGSYLPADIFARYQRLAGNDVLFVSGSDSHGTPITVRADAENTTPEAVYKRFHDSFLDMQTKVGITYDLFTSTHTENHFKVSQDVFLALMENGYLYKHTEKQWYAPSQGRFLPDRYVEGTCYICGYEGARSDQCDKCGSLLDPEKLINPKSKIDGTTPELRDTEHYYLDLGKLQQPVVDFLKEREDYWRPNVVRQSLGQILARTTPDLFDEIVGALASLCGNPTYNSSSQEDPMNDYVRDILGHGLQVRDQTRQGISGRSRSAEKGQAGEIDIQIRNNGRPIGIYEGLRLGGVNSKEIYDHIAKATIQYNPQGVKEIFVVAYVRNQSATFGEFWKRFVSCLREYKNDIDAYQISWDEEEEDTGLSSVRSMHGTYNADDVVHNVHAIAVKLMQ